MTWQQRLRSHRAWSIRIGIVLGAVSLIGLLLTAVDLRPGLKHLKVGLLTGPEAGNYWALGTRLALRAEATGGALRTLSSEGSVDNVEKLHAAQSGCEGIPPGLVREIAPRAEAGLVATLILGGLPRD